MTNNLHKKFIEHLPFFFDCQLDANPFGVGIFEPLRSVIEFDEGYVFFLNPNNFQLKYSIGKDRKHAIGDTFPIADSFRQELFSNSNFIINNNNELINLLGLSDSHSLLVIKLVIKQAVFGFILLCSKNKECYNNNHMEISNALSSVVSYKVKDLELSDIFKNQLKSLKEGFVTTKAAFKTIKEQNLKIIESDTIKNEFLANVSHELRTPLNGIIGFSEILSAKLYGDLNEKQLEFVNDIYISAIHLNNMINEILDISKLEAKAMTINKSEFFVSQTVEEVVNVLKPLAVKKNLDVSVKIIDDTKVFADFQKIKQILYNLLSNAIKFTDDKGKINVIINKNKNNFILEVTDNGIGIDKKDYNKIFEKFVQLENAYTKKESSTGLGLTITKELVEMHKGKIKVESTAGKGSSFIVEIPVNKKINKM